MPVPVGTEAPPAAHGADRKKHAHLAPGPLYRAPMAPKLILAAAVSLLTGPALGLQDASFGSSEPPPTDPWAVSPAPGSADADPWIAFALRALDAHGDDARPALRFLDEHRPASDADLDADLLFNNLDLALRARDEFPWAADVPREIFLNDVLPYAVLDETRENWRPAMLERCRPIVEECPTAAEAAQALNRELFNLVNVHYNTGRKKPNQSPAESMEQGIATCTGLSILLVDACRSVGIPARIAGVANWHNKRGNHTWVEIWDDGWHFMGADEYDAKGVDRGWFVGDARKAVAGSEEHAVWATSWKPTGHHFPMVWDRADTSVHAVDVTARYAPQTKKEETGDKTQTVYFRVFDTRDGERIEATIVALPTPGRPVIIKTNAGTTDLNDMPSLAVHGASRSVSW
jgi:transglutaminase-like putative cysteine protease